MVLQKIQVSERKNDLGWLGGDRILLVFTQLLVVTVNAQHGLNYLSMRSVCLCPASVVATLSVLIILADLKLG